MSAQRVEPVAGLERADVAARPVIRKDGAELVIELLDERERRVELSFSPVQAMRIWTVDLWVPPSEDVALARRVCEVVTSDWLRELATTLQALHPTATFLDEARHFVVWAGDDVVEVVAWQLLWRAGEDHGAHPLERPASSIPGMG